MAKDTKLQEVPQDTITLATKVFTVGGVKVSIIEPFQIGHTLNEAEASVLNQTFRENVRNSTAKEVKECEGDLDKAQSIVTAYASTYKFGVRKSAAQMNPIETEAKKIAVIAVNNALATAGIKKADYEGYAEKVAETMLKPEVVKAAGEIVATREANKAATVSL